MTSKDRILAAINHKEPDKVPIDLGATPSSGISAIAYSNLNKNLGFRDSKTLIYDVVQELAQPEEHIIDKFNIDVLDIGRTFNTREEDWYPVTLSDGSKAYYPTWFKPVKQDDGGYIAMLNDGTPAARKPKGATFFDQTLFPYLDGYPENLNNLPEAMNKVLWQVFAHSPWDHAADEYFWQNLRNNCIELKKTTDKALMIVAGCNLFEWGTFLRRIDNFLMDLYMDPVNVEKLLDKLMEIHLSGLEKICNAVGDVVDILRFGDDLGMDNGPFMEPEIYRTLFKPRHQKLCNFVKENSSMHTFLHSCGSIYKLIPDMIEAGYDIINPVQTNSVDMDPGHLKKEFGKDITFWGGGIDTRSVLNNGTPQQVKDQVKERLDIFMPGGGFVFNTVHNILPDVPPENIIAMYEAVTDYK
ncbi:MAG: uroporphyrinogen decarboxylase family protein [Bacteroidales bacterium]